LKESSTSSTDELKQTLIDEINQFLQKNALRRLDIQHIFCKALTTNKQTAYFLTERLCWFAVAGTIIGARLGEVFFYNWPYYYHHPMDIFKIWQGGLASHGGVIGVICGLFIYLKYVQKWLPHLTFLRLLDFVAVPSALVAVFIRLGNFVNQEIIGIPTSHVFGVIFGHAEDGSTPIPRHPVQLYEAFAYFITFIILWNIWKKERDSEKPGGIVGLLFMLIFGSRFVLEFWKSHQSASIDFSHLQMGQLLSIPFIVFGFFLWGRTKKIFVSKKSFFTT
jgi:prolipoprotein diacylglyceryl transferase